MKILLVEADQAVIATLRRSLSYYYVVDVVLDGEQGWLYGSAFEYDLVILDMALPKLDGLRLCQRFRAEGYTFPILLLMAQNNSMAKVKGFDAGADDCVVKPFDTIELMARIRALVRRGCANPLPLLTWGDLHLDPGSCEVTYSGQLLSLTTKEYDLLELLLRQSHHVFSIDEILDRLWSSEVFPAESTVRSHLRRLRHKLMAAGAPPDFISTLHGRGYYLKLPAQSSASMASVEPMVSPMTSPITFPMTSAPGILWQNGKNTEYYAEYDTDWGTPRQHLAKQQPDRQPDQQIEQNSNQILRAQSRDAIQPTFAANLLETHAPEPAVMIVDQDQIWLQSLPQQLHPWGFSVTTLAEPEQFWTVLQIVNPDLLVLDLDMPELGGLERCQMLRRDPQWQRLPVLFLSVLTDAAMQNQAFSVGADDYLYKPISGYDLAHRLLNRLQRIRAWVS